MDRTNQREIEIRSEEVQEILGTPPGWMVRWGTIVAMVTVVLLGWVGYWVKYPDVVDGAITITTSEPPQRLQPANSNFVSHILVSNEDTVEADQILLVFRSKAKFEDVLVLEDYLLAVENMEDPTLMSIELPRDLLLGNELQDEFYDFIEKQEKLQLMLSPKYEKMSIRQLEQQRRKIRSSIEFDQRRKEKLAEQIDMVSVRLQSYQRRFEENALPYATLRKAKEEVLTLEREMQSIESSIKSKEFEIESIRSQITGVREGKRERQLSASNELLDSFLKLKRSVEAWKEENLMVAPIDGVVYFPENIQEQKYVSANNTLVMVVPQNQSETIGKIKLKDGGSGKVERGQKVIVKLKSYPFQEFGALTGKVSWIGKVPTTENAIPVHVRFDQELRTTTGRLIEPSREMEGDAEIITEDKRFIERIFERIRGIGS